MASSRTATLVTPLPPLRTGTPYAGQTSLSSSSALADRSSSANHITPTWVSAAVVLCICPLQACSIFPLLGGLSEKVSGPGGDKTSKICWSHASRSEETYIRAGNTSYSAECVHQAFVALRGGGGFRGHSGNIPRIELYFLPVGR